MNHTRRSTKFLFAIAALIVGILPTSVDPQSAGPVLVARFAGNLNSKSAKVGDVIQAKVLKPAKLKDGTAIPKGSKLTGTVSTVKSRQEGNGTATLAITFGRLETKGGVSLPIKGLIVAIGRGTESANSVDYNTVAGGLDGRQDPFRYRDESDIPRGSTLAGFGLKPELDANGASALTGYATDIKLDANVLVNVELE